MAHRVHPKIFRTKRTEDWNSRWFERKNFSKFLEEDFRIKEFLTKKLNQMGLEKIEIERFPGKLNIIIDSARPGLIIGRGGAGIEELKKALEKRVLKKKEKSEIKLEIREVRDVWGSSQLVARWIAQQIERRFPYRRVLKQALDRIVASKKVQGARVEIAGRLGGAEIARREWLKKGKLPRQTLRADIDYGQTEAFCTYGVIVVKVWIYKGEKFE